MQPRCDACRYFQTVPTVDVHGLCRRQPPQRNWIFTGLNGPGSAAVINWPPVAPHDWCGEFKPRGKAPPPAAPQRTGRH